MMMLDMMTMTAGQNVSSLSSEIKVKTRIRVRVVRLSLSLHLHPVKMMVKKMQVVVAVEERCQWIPKQLK